MKDKFIVKIRIDPENEDSEYKEIRFKSRKDISDVLKIPMNNIITMINHNFKCVHPKHKHLKGITIERIIYDNEQDKYNLPDAVEFRKHLLEQIS